MKTRPKKEPIRLLLADDHPVVLDGVRSALSKHKQIRIVGEATSGKQALQKLHRLNPDIVLMDISMPVMNGIETTKKLREVLPHIKVLAFTMHENKEYVIEIIRSGAKGYILKNTATPELVKAIETVYAGGTYFSSKVSKLLLDQYVSQVAQGRLREDLTSREKQILALIADGKSSKEIAVHFNLSVRTVDTHREKIMKKLQIHSAVGLAKYAIAKGIVVSTEPDTELPA
ncbi:MAG: response regulator transcription factor [Bacteroidota bacterium]